MEKNEHYYTRYPKSEILEREFVYSLKGVTLRLTSVSGVFAFSGNIDKASELLIKNFLPSGESVLDLGCGYGAIGLFLKAIHTNLHVSLSDINSRALDFARANARKNNLDVTVIESDLYAKLDSSFFDDIVVNPPMAAGKNLNTRLIKESLFHLNNSGSLWLVAYHNKGGSTLKEIMKSSFGNVEDMEKSGGIRVYRSVKA